MMEKLILERVRTGEDGTFGHLFWGGSKIAVTCELPWKNNAPQISCVPKGNYMVGRYISPSKNKQVGGEVFLLKAVPARSMIEVHIGNTIRDLRGCIAVGDQFGEVTPKKEKAPLPAVLNSTDTMKRLLEELPRVFYLHITGVCG